MPASGGPSTAPLSTFDRDDPARIAHVRRLVLEARGDAIDRLARLAAQVTGAPYAQVSLLTDRQVVAGLHGLELPERESPLEDSLCTVTATAGEPVSVSDGPADDRVSALPPVVSGAVRAYLGAPIVAGGDTVGALCVYGPEQRDWSAADVRTVQSIAETVGAELELGGVTARAVQDAVRLDLGFEAAQIGGFDWDLRTDELHWDGRLRELFGYTGETFVPHIDSFSERVHPADRVKVDTAIRTAIEMRRDLSTEYRVILPDGTIRWIAARGRVLCGPGGEGERLLGAAYDTTALHDTAGRVTRVLESMTSAFFALDRDWRFTYVNAQAEQLLERGRDELIGRVVWEEFPEAVGTPIHTNYLRAVESGAPLSFEGFYGPLDARYEIRAQPTTEGLSVFFHDISARVEAEEERERALKRLELLSLAGERLSATLEIAGILDVLEELACPRFGAWTAMALRDDAAGLLDGREFADGPEIRVVRVAAADRARGRELSAALDGMEVVPAAGGRWEPAGEAGATAPLTVPLVSRGHVMGALLVGDPTDDADELRLLGDVAARGAAALDNALLYAAERRAAVALQHLLIPTELPPLAGIEAAVRYFPGTAGEKVGGDFYIGHQLDDGRVLLIVGDVMGHGMPAAARMGQLRAVLTAYAFDGDPPDVVLDRVVARANDLLDVQMATVLIVIYDPATRTLTAANAGHPPPLLAPPDAPPEFLPVVPGAPIGADIPRYPTLSVTVPPQSTIVLYTDGLIENRSESIDTGLERLREALVEVRLPPETVSDHILEKLGRSMGGRDDVALLVFRTAGTMLAG
jgi:GAF domain-containing protein